MFSALPRLLLLATALAGSFVVLLTASPSKTQAQSCGEPSSLRFDIVGKIVRSQLGFTQGLEFRDGQLYESTGRIGGTTQLNTISLTGQVKTLADQGTSVFGEGLTIPQRRDHPAHLAGPRYFVYDLAGKLKRACAIHARAGD